MTPLEEYRNWIFQQLIKNTKGLKGKSEILENFRKTFGKEKTCFNEAWKHAKIDYIDFKKQETNEIAQLAQKQSKKFDIISQNEMLEILSNQARGKAFRVEGQLILPSITERQKAIELVCKILGYFQATRVEHDLLTPVKIVLKNKPKSDDI